MTRGARAVRGRFSRPPEHGRSAGRRSRRSSGNAPSNTGMPTGRREVLLVGVKRNHHQSVPPRRLPRRVALHEQVTLSMPTLPYSSPSSNGGGTDASLARAPDRFSCCPGGSQRGSWQVSQSLSACFCWWHSMQLPIERIFSRHSASRSFTGPWQVSHDEPASTCTLCEKKTKLGIW